MSALPTLVAALEFQHKFQVHTPPRDPMRGDGHAEPPEAIPGEGEEGSRQQGAQREGHGSTEHEPSQRVECEAGDEPVFPSCGLIPRDSSRGGVMESEGLTISVHGPGASIDAAIQAAEATKALLEEVAREKGIPDGAIKWTIGSVQFRCDGCGLLRPDKPSPDEGWTYSDLGDLCPACSEAKG